MNCSNNGNCILDQNSKYVCECQKNYAGSNCQINTLPCASYPCRNNGSCLDNLLNKTYSCECSLKNETLLFYGQNCENKIDVCANETCSNRGYCYDTKDEAKCKCFTYYSGDKCEEKSKELKAIEAVITTSAIIAIITICLTYGMIVINDLLNIFCRKKEKKSIYIKQKSFKPIYVN
ncbi:unnamed protein product [Brachionus calyciflorus]|uniref:EGF-like domain-containing protein n=1 Tax=Brachionus calyciflorus TaxID=104777 RepID=A0A814ETD9_9BILA|nr:unnamed protein product [Brachionus calyciflorus]